MVYWVALLAAVGCALCNGVAVVLQKIGADRQARATSVQIQMFARLFREWHYVAGLILDSFALVLTLIAVHSLPLFVVQPITSFSVVVAAVAEHIVLRRRVQKRTIAAITIIVAGLTMLAAAAGSEQVQPVSATVTAAIVLMPIILAVVGVSLVHIKRRYAAIALTAISGLGFGSTAIIGRMLDFSSGGLHAFTSPLFFAMIAYGIVGLVLFTIALQRLRASVATAVMITFETLAPTAVGLAFLGDSPKPGWWLIMALGAAIALTGAIIIMLRHHHHKPETTAVLADS